MMQKFTTKRDINGNRYTLIIDHVKKEYKPDYNSAYDYSDFITITRRDREKLIEQATAAGYSRTY